MFKQILLGVFCFLGINLFIPNLLANNDSSVEDDSLFLSLREAARKNDLEKIAILGSRLSDYEMLAYVDYYQLRPRLAFANSQEIRDYFSKYPGLAITDRLRNDWLLELGRSRDFQTFDEQYPLFVLNDDTQVKCYHLLSKVLKNQNVAPAARLLLTKTKEYGNACFELIQTLQAKQQFTSQDVWMQARLASEQNDIPALRQLLTILAISPVHISQALSQPARFLTSYLVEPGHFLIKKINPAVVRTPHKTKTLDAIWVDTDRPTNSQLFTLILGRLSKIDSEQALALLVAHEKQLSNYDKEVAWAQLAFSASLKSKLEAANFWRKSNNVALSNEGYQWRTRAALRTGDWKMVQQTIETMPTTLRKEPAWIYWLGRSLAMQGQVEQADTLFESIADEYHFYGQLAVEELGEKIVSPSMPPVVTTEELQDATNNLGLQRSIKFLRLGLRFEAMREWNWELRKMNDRQLLAAAEFARRNHMLDRMVNTSNRTKKDINFMQRFPTPFYDVVKRQAQPLNLDVAWTYGLIRQESRFVMNARSVSGASGLMQLMPATAKYVAQKIGLNTYAQQRIDDIDTNILLGTSYLSMVLNQFEGSQVLASAAYNAGPSRSVAWRASLPFAVEGAIFAETIPFDETRDYVKNVLSNATYYAALLEQQPQSLKARLGIIALRGF